jgi:hypothetical protein
MRFEGHSVKGLWDSLFWRVTCRHLVWVGVFLLDPTVLVVSLRGCRVGLFGEVVMLWAFCGVIMVWAFGGLVM